MLFKIRRLYQWALFASGAMVPVAALVHLVNHTTVELVIASCLAFCLGLFPIYLPKGVIWGAGIITTIYILLSQGFFAACTPMLFCTLGEFLRHYKWKIAKIRWYRFMVTSGMFLYSLCASAAVSRYTQTFPPFFHIFLSLTSFEIVNLLLFVGILLSLRQPARLGETFGMFNFIPLLATSTLLTMYVAFAHTAWFALLVVILLTCFVLLSRQFLQAVNSRDQAERQYELIAHYTTDLIMVVNADNVIAYASPSHEQVFHVDASSLVGKRIDEISDDGPTIFATINRIRQDGTHERQEITLVMNGQQLPVETEFSPVLNESGDVFDVILASRDITERLRQQEYLVHSEKLAVIGQLAAGVAHEIRNPLTAVKGFVQVLRSDFDAYSQSSYDIVWSELTRIEEITSELLLLAKPQKAEFNTVNLVPVMKHCVTLLEGQAHKRDVYFDLAWNHAVYVDCNENQIRQVFVNLLKNAVESMEDGGVITIAARLVEDVVTISIRDEGVGIPEELKASLGDPFYTTKEKGTGLGLMVVYNILKEHQGSIEIHSEPGLGTEVVIMLPNSSSSAVLQASTPSDHGMTATR